MSERAEANRTNKFRLSCDEVDILFDMLGGAGDGDYPDTEEKFEIIRDCIHEQIAAKER